MRVLTNDEIIERIVKRHFKKLEGFLLDLNLPRLAYVAISKEFRFMEQDLKESLTFQGDDLNYVLNNERGNENDR